MLKEFKEFAMRGNVADMAIGIVIGVAFGAIVSSLVADVIMPVVGLLLGGVDFASMFAVLKEGTAPGPYTTIEEARKVGAVTMNYGVFINTIVNFLIVAFCMFLIVRAMNRMKKTEPAPAPPPPTAEQALLEDIRDILKSGGRR